MKDQFLPYNPAKSQSRVAFFVGEEVGISQSAAARWCQNGRIVDAATKRALKKGDLVPQSGILIVSPPTQEESHARGELNVLLESDRLLYLNKPAGLPTLGKNQDDIGSDSIAYRLSSEFKWTDAKELHDRGLCHRLDNDTSGILIVAKDASQQQAIRGRWQDVHKGYLALLGGNLDAMCLQNELIAHHPTAQNKMVVLDEDQDAGLKGRRAETLFCPILQGDNVTLAAVFLKSPGNRHQIRVHAQALEMPLLGDKTYDGARCEVMSTHALHATLLKLPENAPVFAPWPDAFEAEMQAQGLKPPDFNTICERFLELSQK